MSWNPFANHVYDEELCFCRDFIEVITKIRYMTTNIAWQSVGLKIIEDLNLLDKMQEYSNLSARTIVEDCYPSDRNKRIKYAKALFQLVKSFGFNQEELCNALIPVIEISKKMKLDSSEKEYLIRTYISTKTGDPKADDYLVKMWNDAFRW